MGLHSAPSPHLWMHPLVLKLLAEMTAESISIICARSWRTGEVIEDWRKTQITPIFKKDKKDLGNYRPASLTSIPGDSDGTTCLGCHLQASGRENIYIRNSQHEFSRRKSCLTNLVAFCNAMTSWVDEGRAEDVVYLDFNKAFDNISYNIHVTKLRKWGKDEWTLRWIENCLTGRAQ